MKSLTTIKHTGLDTFAIHNSESELIATAKKSEDGGYDIYIYGGAFHGKITKAADWQHLNDKSVEIANLAA